MPSTKAKELAAKQKAEVRAAKLAKKNSTNPADWGRWRQVKEAYRLTHEHDPQLPLWLAAGFAVPVLITLVLGLILKPVWLWVLLGVSAGLLVAMLILVRRAKQATFKRYAGQAGSAEVALQMLPKQWMHTPAITATRQQDVVHRALGPGGLVLIGEGEPGRLRPLLAQEAKRHEQAANGVKVLTVQMGDRDGQVPLPKLADHLKKLPKTLDANQITKISARLRALDAMRPRVPVPRGPLPTTKGSRRAMRGR